jgi:peroxiredoxin (alkyl hydroperoxide reductase subunit C)
VCLQIRALREKEFTRMIRINDRVADVELNVYHENEFKKVGLSAYKGRWVVLFFYPADFTFVCPTELAELADMYEQFQEEQAEIISVSTDTVFVHKAWHDSSPAVRRIRFPMAADPTGALSRLFGTYIENEGLALRGTFLVDPDGVLKCAEYHDLSIGRSGVELLRKVQAARFVRENGGEVCPASWKPGKKTLRPDIELVGKI